MRWFHCGLFKRLTSMNNQISRINILTWKSVFFFCRFDIVTTFCELNNFKNNTFNFVCRFLYSWRALNLFYFVFFCSVNSHFNINQYSHIKTFKLLIFFEGRNDLQELVFLIRIWMLFCDFFFFFRGATYWMTIV